MVSISIIDLAAVAEKSYADPASLERGNFHAVYAEISGVTIVGVRGTRTPADLITDANVLPRWRRDIGWCHSGFLDDVEAVEHELIAFLAGKRYILDGHSKGGSEALIGGGILTAAGNPPLAIVCFGPARPASMKLANVLGPVRKVLLRHARDPIPMLEYGFRLPGDLVQFGTPTPSIDPVDDHYLAAYRADLHTLPASVLQIHA